MGKFFVTACWVRLFHLWQFFYNLFHYYLRVPRFFLVDCLLTGWYALKTPFSYIREYDEAHPEATLGPYGETEFSLADHVFSVFAISKDAVCVDLGTGRGRLCFWLRLVRGQRSVIGIEAFPLFVERAKCIQRLCGVDGLEFIQGGWSTEKGKEALRSADVIYLYGSALSDEAIHSLGLILSQLPRGTKIISTSYWFGEDFPEGFLLEATTDVRFIWGTGTVFLQSVL